MLADFEPPKHRAAVRLALQGVGFLVSLGALAWALSLALSDDNREKLAHLREAAAGPVIALLGATAMSVILNGVMFWLLIRRHRPIAPLAVVATNAIAVFLSILPFKLGLVVRGLIHHRRDRVPFKLLVAWLAAMAALGLASLLPMAGAGLWLKEMNTRWAIAALGGFTLAHAGAYACARLALRHRLLARLSLGSDALLRDGRTLFIVALARLGDVAMISVRFYLASRIAGHELPLNQCILYGSAFFLISVVSPGGALGFREAGVAALALALGLDSAALALIAAVVSLAEVLTSAAMALAGCFIVRPDKLFLNRR